MNLKAVFFDLDGTLLDTSQDLGKALNRLCAEENLAAIPYDDIREQVSNGASAMIKLAFGDMNEEGLYPLRQRLLDYYLDDIATHTQAFPGIPELISKLTQVGLAWGIVTNKPSLYTRELMRHFEFASPPSATICPDDVGIGKPNPKGLLKACTLTGCTPTEAIYIGDHQRDIETGLNAAMPTIAVGFGFTQHPDEHKTWGATHAVDSADEIWPLLLDHYQI
jgi:N-acetyl-D-muramate 6-phosphate phosphatase